MVGLFDSILDQGILIDYSNVSRWAIVENGVVTNTVLWSGNEDDWKPPEDCVIVKLTDADKCGFGWTYSNGSFTPPPEEPSTG